MRGNLPDQVRHTPGLSPPGTLTGWLRPRGGVYPRACGGTPGICDNADEIGPHAGEPVMPEGRGRVYPRACGGTLCPAACMGLSPLSEPTVCSQWGGWDRVYPRACGGTKDERIAWPRTSRVYPRACGGTDSSIVIDTKSWGLSPRMRGNQVAIILTAPSVGLSPRMRGNRSEDCPR